MTENQKYEMQTAMKLLKKSLKRDPDYAWTWRNAIVNSMKDAGASHKIASESAVRFMKNFLDTDISKEFYLKLEAARIVEEIKNFKVA